MKSWLPWRYLVSHIARRQGFLDPFSVLARLRQFSQPSEVQEPIELIRAGVAFHARGLVNTKVLQNNLDWVWPYWASRQFDPCDTAFLPRAFAVTHVNLTHRNWTALGLPGMDLYPIVDPRGLVTPQLDGWSLDWWFVPADGSPPLYPSREPMAEQRLELSDGLEVVTVVSRPDCRLRSSARVVPADGDPHRPELRLQARVRAKSAGHLALAVRPANPEGVSFVDTIERRGDALHIDGSPPLRADRRPTHWLASTYRGGDIAAQLEDARPPRHDAAAVTRCSSGLATGAWLFEVAAGAETTVSASLPVSAGERPLGTQPAATRLDTWSHARSGAPACALPNQEWRFLHDAALHTLLLLSPAEIYPGPYTYRRFWFRDACLILNALVAANQLPRARALLETFPRRQRRDGYFHSQEGEWDANGQVLWIADRIEATDHEPLSPAMWKALKRGVEWIGRKCVSAPGRPHDGLLPPGFSAEHLGPNDYYYWDDLWALAGLKAGVRMARRRQDEELARQWTLEAERLAQALTRSFDGLPAHVKPSGLPASPYRRLDSGAIGSMVGDYPLQLDELGPERFERTADWLTRNCLHRGGFFQDMIHSGINAYLSLALAETLLRKGDPRYLDLIDAVARAASPTGQWPEAIHPLTGGGCMGDGQHAWAAAEWLLMMRALFVREEADHLIIGSGLPERWFSDEMPTDMHYGPTATPWGPVTVQVQRRGTDWHLRFDADWHDRAPPVQVRVPGFEPITAAIAGHEFRLEFSASARERHSVHAANRSSHR